MKTMRELGVLGGDFYIENCFFVMMNVFIVDQFRYKTKCFYLQRNERIIDIVEARIANTRYRV